jgi:hypothetical protein
MTDLDLTEISTPCSGSQPDAARSLRLGDDPDVGLGLGPAAEGVLGSIEVKSFGWDKSESAAVRHRPGVRSR